MAWLHAVLDVPEGQRTEASEFWGAALGWPAGNPWPTHPELRSFEPPDGTAYVHLQEIRGVPRVHVDVESDAPDTAVKEATGLGAVLVARRPQWVTLRSPGGLPFCILKAGRHRVPQPVTFPDGHSARMVQVCVDSPRSAYQREVRFWRGLLGGRWVPSEANEFAGKWHDDAGSPLQLLFQRLDEDGGAVRAHLDQGTDDIARETDRLVRLGAADIGPGAGWRVLRAPNGMPFCVTRNSPLMTRCRDLG